MRRLPIDRTGLAVAAGENSRLSRACSRQNKLLSGSVTTPMLAHGQTVGEGIACHPRLSAVGSNQRGQDLEQGGLAGPIGAEHDDHLAFGHCHTESPQAGSGQPWYRN